eukprot:300234-Karenia_brevis.AAC.1
MGNFKPHGDSGTQGTCKPHGDLHIPLDDPRCIGCVEKDKILMASVQELQNQMAELGAMSSNPHLTATQKKQFYARNYELQSDIRQLQQEILSEAANRAGQD